MSSSLRVIFSGGGTGGHVFPALAVANRLREVVKDAQIFFLGTRKGLESVVVPQADFAIEYVHACGLTAHPLKVGRVVYDNLRGIWQARSWLGSFRPHVVVGSGGYVSVPVGMAAWSMGVPLILLEQNVVPGKATSLMSRYAARVCISFDATSKLLRPDARCVVTGNPVRREILERRRGEARRAMGVRDDAFCLLVTGASQGARSINDAVLAALPKWKSLPWHVIHLTGRREYTAVRQRAEHLTTGGKLVWDGRDFVEDMASVYAAADLVVSRAGATSLAEIMARGLPSVLIPYPYAAGHQWDNAMWLTERGGAVTLADEAVVDKLEMLVSALAKEPQRRQQMAQAARHASRPSAADHIATEIVKATRFASLLRPAQPAEPDVQVRGA